MRTKTNIFLPPDELFNSLFNIHLSYLIISWISIISIFPHSNEINSFLKWNQFGCEPSWTHQNFDTFQVPICICLLNSNKCKSDALQHLTGFRWLEIVTQVGLMKVLLPSIEPLVILRMGKYFQSFVFTLSYIKHHLLGTGSSQITRFDCMLSNIFVQNINWQCFSVGCPAGLSVAQSDRVTGKLPLKGDMLTKRKVSFSLCFWMFFIFFSWACLAAWIGCLCASTDAKFILWRSWYSFPYSLGFWTSLKPCN